MRIYTMTATFGKLEHETLMLQPGLNIITARNEWGKSTWCAFLTAMLYGLDTRTKTTRTALAEKERYAPWSGRAMSGRIDLSWNGRDITIERKTKGRIPMGDFRAYETQTGLEMAELTAENCGQQLLGVERSVFLRSGFIRFNDMPVSDDEALRRRLNNLVTTGDENSSADRLAKGLKDLKNRVRYNRTGLLPQAEAERERLEMACRELDELEIQCEKVQRRMDEIEDWRMALENHKTALAYAASREDARKVEQAEQARDDALGQLENITALCDALPERETAEQLLHEINRLQENLINLQTQLQTLPTPDQEVEVPVPFRGMRVEEAYARVKADMNRHWNLKEKKDFALIFGVVLACAGALIGYWYPIPGLICACAGAVVTVAALMAKLLRHRQIKALETLYGADDADQWMRMAEEYAAAAYARAHSVEENRRERSQLEQQLKELNTSIREATQNQGLEQCRSDWEGVLAAWDSYAGAVREYRRAEAHLQTLKSMAKPAVPPEFPDRMEYTEAETRRLLSDCFGERRRLENLLGQYQGRMAAMGTRAALEEELTRVNARIGRLEETYAALTIAQETLSEAAAELQRRFAPRISSRAQTLMAQMTSGRYDRLSLGTDLSIRAGAAQEDTLHEALWRSDGTVDQLYLALRLAVADELTPEAPVILDDALVRFDDERLKAALDILKEEAQRRQVILFTCQNRETNLI